MRMSAAALCVMHKNRYLCISNMFNSSINIESILKTCSECNFGNI